MAVARRRRGLSTHETSVVADHERGRTDGNHAAKRRHVVDRTLFRAGQEFVVVHFTDYYTRRTERLSTTSAGTYSREHQALTKRADAHHVSDARHSPEDLASITQLLLQSMYQ